LRAAMQSLFNLKSMNWNPFGRSRPTDKTRQ
jgi:hypothetical protein